MAAVVSAIVNVLFMYMSSKVIDREYSLKLFGVLLEYIIIENSTPDNQVSIYTHLSEIFFNFF